VGSVVAAVHDEEVIISRDKIFQLRQLRRLQRNQLLAVEVQIVRD
jgi:hypothetical protein